MKKLFTAIIISAMAILCAASANAKDMNMYINGMYSTQDIQTVGGFDMLPVEDIAGYLGFTSYYDGYTLTLYGTDRTYYFHVGDAVVTDNAGGWYGLDITPREINGKIRIPAKFFCDAFGMPYTWDGLTETLFLNSDYTYNWLINTWEYKQGNAINKTWNEVQGYWFHCEDPYTQSTNIQFNSDGTFYLRTWRVKGYGTYTVTGENTVVANYDIYFNGAGSSSFNYYYSSSDTYKLTGYGLVHVSSTSDGKTYQYNDRYEHRNSFTMVYGQN